MKSKHFLYLEIMDPEINSLILRIMEIISGNKPFNSLHLTVRGPYRDKIPIKTIKQCEEIMKNDVLEIGPVGRFSNFGEEVVYFRVNSPHLREVWWKPDFPIEKVGFNPHFSLYRGKDSSFADFLENFLKEKEIKLLCAEYRLVPHVTKQIELIPRIKPKKRENLNILRSDWIDENFLMDFEQAIEDFNSGKTC